ncbi:hypothetical protein A2U01_0049310, partial [Trifolium medium]|nr:hypothetical protein [Trifolium medium]
SDACPFEKNTNGKSSSCALHFPDQHYCDYDCRCQASVFLRRSSRVNVSLLFKSAISVLGWGDHGDDRKDRIWATMERTERGGGGMEMDGGSEGGKEELTHMKKKKGYSRSDFFIK